MCILKTLKLLWWKKIAWYILDTKIATFNLNDFNEDVQNIIELYEGRFVHQPNKVKIWT